MLSKLSLRGIGLISIISGCFFSAPIIFADVTEAELHEIETQATINQSINSARQAFNKSIERTKTLHDAKEFNAIAESLEKAKVWHVRSMVLAERDIGISSDESARQNVVARIHHDHGAIFYQIFQYIGSTERELSIKQYIISAINWSRDHITNWPNDDKQDIISYGMSPFLNTFGLSNDGPALIEKSLWEGKRLECLKNLEERHNSQGTV
ncbi:MAG: hypothetical protein AB8G05_20745 [Oligoflexales bacterium]